MVAPATLAIAKSTGAEMSLADLKGDAEFQPKAEWLPPEEGLQAKAEWFPPEEGLQSKAEMLYPEGFQVKNGRPPSAELQSMAEWNSNPHSEAVFELNSNSDFASGPSLTVDGQRAPNADLNLNAKSYSSSDSSEVSEGDAGSYDGATAYPEEETEATGDTNAGLNGSRPNVKNRGLAGSKAEKLNLPLTSFERRQKLNASIDKMNDSFFMNIQAQKKLAQQLAVDGGEGKVLPFDRPGDLQRSLVDDVQVWKQNEAINMPEQPIGKTALASNAFESSYSDSGDFESEAENLDTGESGIKQKDADFESQVYGRLNSEWQPSKLAVPQSDLNASGLHMSNIDKIRNMQNLIENAKILSQNGGGEMQMKLSPEGLGEVQLKVVVANGKVDLELKSQNHEVKKMLESTINELKTSLAQHSLSIDKVKVDVGSQDSTSSGDSFLKQFQMNDNREQARQFLGQFRENNFSQRNNMLDVPGFKSYQSQRGDDLEPVRNQPVRPRSMERNKGQGLNLVA
jgi:hypothetical protein